MRREEISSEHQTCSTQDCNDFGATIPLGETFRLNVFLRDGERVFHTYSTDGRGVDRLGSNWTLLDLTPFGRQEEWEDSPDGWPQSRPYEWWNFHDEYDATS